MSPLSVSDNGRKARLQLSIYIFSNKRWRVLAFSANAPAGRAARAPTGRNYFLPEQSFFLPKTVFLMIFAILQARCPALQPGQKS